MHGRQAGRYTKIYKLKMKTDITCINNNKSNENKNNRKRLSALEKQQWQVIPSSNTRCIWWRGQIIYAKDRLSLPFIFLSHRPPLLRSKGKYCSLSEEGEVGAEMIERNRIFRNDAEVFPRVSLDQWFPIFFFCGPKCRDWYVLSLWILLQLLFEWESNCKYPSIHLQYTAHYLGDNVTGYRRQLLKYSEETSCRDFNTLLLFVTSVFSS